MQKRTALAIGIGAVAIACGLLWLIWARPRVIAGRQLRNYADIRTYASFVQTYFESHGSMPQTLAEAVPERVSHRDMWLAARDVYGHPLHYEVRGGDFLIASYGRDDNRDRGPYARQGGDPQRIAAPCYDADTDTAYSSDGVFQACAK